MASREPGRRGLSHYLRGRTPAQVARLLSSAVQATGGPGEDFYRRQLMEHFRASGMTESEADAFAGELVYGSYAVELGEPGHYMWEKDVYRLVRHRAWRFPRGQLDLPAALQFIDIVAQHGGPLALTPDLRALYQRLKDATKVLK